MALFQRKTIAASTVPLYTLGLRKDLVIIGLGNPEAQYDGTRHNIGFAALDSLQKAMDFPEFSQKRDLKALVTSQTVNDMRVVLVKPTTFMNLSGEAAHAVCSFYKASPSRVVVVHDELAIPFGQIRMRSGGEAAGHNGIKSLIQHFGKEFGRVRVGIHNDIADKADQSDFVLGKFTKAEQELLPSLLRETNAILSELSYGQDFVAETRSFIV